MRWLKYKIGRRNLALNCNMERNVKLFGSRVISYLHYSASFVYVYIFALCNMLIQYYNYKEVPSFHHENKSV